MWTLCGEVALLLLWLRTDAWMCKKNAKTMNSRIDCGDDGKVNKRPFDIFKVRTYFTFFVFSFFESSDKNSRASLASHNIAHIPDNALLSCVCLRRLEECKSH
ncbi:hypothetical protein L596_000990 [Steinernema carpocapsae]|uniref:Secreted protein n=1 Tax=Steinernema carpocapsae TaxID=34508 RepID=A0A4U8UNZ0_STECR|nr:hypothetical protein L596_000990 [Steinernema carpocapsae]